MTTNPVIVIAILAGFYAIVAACVIYGHKPQTSVEEYGVAGRSMGWLVVCFSYMGGWYAGALYTGWFAFSTDYGLFAQYLIIYSTGGLIIMYLMARPVWAWGKEFNLETQSDLIFLRYESRPFAECFTILTIVVSSLWLVLEMVTLGLIVSIATNNFISYEVGLIVLGGGVILYSLIGGVRATAIGALVQGITFTVVGTLTFYILIVRTYGGVVPLFDMLRQSAPDLLTLNEGKGLDMKWISAILTGTFGAFCWPSIFSRMYMGSSPRETKRAVLVAPICAILIAVTVLWFAIGGRLVPGFPDDAQSGVFWLANEMGGAVALGLVAVFASSAAVSTASAMANSTAVLLAKNLLGRYVHGDRQVLTMAKGATAVLGALAIAIAMIDLPQLVTIALAGYDCIVQIIVPLLLGAYWRRGNLIGAVSGLTVGVVIAAAALIWPALVAWTGGVSGGLIGLAVNAAVYIACGYLFEKHQHTDALFNVLDRYDDEGKKWDVALNEPLFSNPKLQNAKSSGKTA